MLQQALRYLLHDASYASLFLLNLLYFAFLYFGLAPLFQAACKKLHRHGWLQKIIAKDADTRQIRFEIRHSAQSILIFGGSIIPVLYLIRAGEVVLLPDTAANVCAGLLILSLWNELHFFIVHRIMHLPFFMKHVHRIHHQSRIATVYSVYSFHWLEALLLSTVPLTLVPFVPVAFLSIALYPLVSILINYSGHCNYRFGNGTGQAWSLFGTYHNEHHFRNKKRYGFVMQIFDDILSKLTGTKPK